MTMDSEVRIRPAATEDIEWILALVPRLHEFGPPRWRDQKEMDAAESEVVREALSHPTEESIVLVATDPGGAPLGFIHLVTVSDYFTGKWYGHISALVVSPEGEGRGAGRGLIAAGEEWARLRKYPWLSLSVFEGNERARNLYDRLGYRVDTCKMIKVLDDNPG